MILSAIVMLSAAFTILIAVPVPLVAPICETSTSPMGIPITVVPMIPSKIAPLTLRSNRIIVKNSPMMANNTVGLFKATKAGTALELAMTVPLSRRVYVPGSEVKLSRPALFTPM